MGWFGFVGADLTGALSIQVYKCTFRSRTDVVDVVLSLLLLIFILCYNRFIGGWATFASFPVTPSHQSSSFSFA